MKTYVMFLALYFFLVYTSTAHLRNGYIDVAGARASLVSIQKLLKEGKDLPLLEKESMKNKRDKLIEYITYHDLTEKLIAQFRLISEELFNEIDTLTNASQGRVDVYVKFVDEKFLPAGIAATTNVEQDKSDPHSYRSEYGLNSVSVIISVGKKSLMLLAHELGHVRYQVQNLAEYMNYYKSHYGDNYHRKSVGHNDKDASGKMASSFVNRFLEDYARYQKSGRVKLVSHITILKNTREEVQRTVTY